MKRILATVAPAGLLGPGKMTVVLAAWFWSAGLASLSADETRQVLDDSGVQGGLVVHVGCGNGRLTAALRAGEGFVICGLETDFVKVEAARAAFHRAGLGGKVFAEPWDGKRLPFADNMVNLLVVSVPSTVAKEEALRVLAPRGVVITLDPQSEIRNPKWGKPWPKEMDEWSHWDHAADGNPVSADTLVGPPREVQWVDGPAFSKQHWGPRIGAMVTAGGRLYTVEDQTPTSMFNIADRWVLVARDAFNGIVLWQRELPKWAGGVWSASKRSPEGLRLSEQLTLGASGILQGGGGRTALRGMVADGDRLFVSFSMREPLAMLDGATGNVLKTFQGLPAPQQIAFAEGLLLVADGKNVCMVDPQVGEKIWQAAGSDPSVKDGKAFVLRGGKGGEAAVVCLDLKTGREVWHTPCARAVKETGAKLDAGTAQFAGPLQVGAGIVMAAGNDAKRGNATLALSAADGKPLWQIVYRAGGFARNGGPFFISDGVWLLQSTAGKVEVLDPRTGQVKSSVDSPGIRYVGHHGRCYSSRATSRYIISKERGAEFVDLATGEVNWHNWVRGPCQRGVMPANGLLYAGQHSCRCYTDVALRGFYALAPKRASSPAAPTDAAERLLKGSAYVSIKNPQSAIESPSDWPTYRHDPARSGTADCTVTGPLAVKWSATLGGRLTAPVVSEGRVLVAGVNDHTVYAIDARTGRITWCYTAGGRIDSPPTIHAGLALFGCHDGHVYALRAADGALVWRFRAGPEGRMVGAYGQIESAWPVPGSILVRENPGGTPAAAAYFVSGRSSFLDGGMHVWALDPATGKVLASRALDGPWPGPETGRSKDTPSRGYVIPGAAPDVLVADGQHVYLRTMRFDPALKTMLDTQPNLYQRTTGKEGESTGGDVKYWDNYPDSPRHATWHDPEFFDRSFFNNFPGMRLFTTSGILDNSWHRRMYWSYGQVAGQYLVFKGRMGYAVQIFASATREGGFNAGEGYVLIAGQTAEKEVGKKLYALKPQEHTWRVRLPFRPQAMVLATDQLILAGPPDLKDPTEALTALEGRKGGVLWIVSAADGKKVSERALEAPPIYDGVAVAGGRVYMAATDGKLYSLGGVQ